MINIMIASYNYTVYCVILLLEIFILAGCHSNYVKEKVSTLYEIEIDESSLTATFDLTDFIDEIEVIPLVEREGYFIGDIYKAFYNKNHFIIYDRFNAPQVSLYGLNGEFIKRVLSIGKGPSEALQIDDCWLNDDETFEAWDQSLKKIFRFDNNFEFKETLNLKEGLYHNVIKVPNSEYYMAYVPISAYNRKFENKYYQLLFLDQNLKKQVGFFEFNDNIKGSLLLSFNNQFYIFNDTVRFMRSYDNNIYNFVGKELINEINIKYRNSINRIEFEELVIAHPEIFKNSSSYGLNESKKLLNNMAFFAGNWIENKDYIFFTSTYDYSKFITIIDKSTHKVIANTKVLQEKNKYNIILPQMINYNNNYFIGFINTYYLEHYLLEGSTLRQLVKSNNISFLMVRVKLKTMR